jgi:hypothetical protein
MFKKPATLKEAIAMLEIALASVGEFLEEEKEETQENDAVSSTQPLYRDADREFTAADVVQGYKPKGKVMPAAISDRFKDPNYGLGKVRRSK